MRNEWTGISVCVMSGLVHVRNEWTGISMCVMSGLVLVCACMSVVSIEILCCMWLI